MLINGHEWIDNPRFVKVFSMEDINKSKIGDILLLEPLNVSISFAKHCQKNSLPLAITINTLKVGHFC